MNGLNTWLPLASCRFDLKKEVHIWRLSFSVSSSLVTKYEAVLDKEEKQRARKFHFEKDRIRYIITRGQLRFLLGKYLNKEANHFTFTYNKYGKPALANSEIQFNVSHSKDMGLLIFDKEYEVGVDIEWMRSDFGGLKIAERFFSADEIEELKSLPPEQQQQGFFNCWSRKEAYIKAVGKGLSIPLTKFSVSLSPQKKTVLKSTTHAPQNFYTYSLYELFAHPAYAAAAVVHKDRNVFKLFDTF